MSEYTNFPIDFIRRTRLNLDHYVGDFEVTNLINNCLGLIIIPKQLLPDNIIEYVFNEDDTTFGICLTNIRFEEKHDYSLNNILRHIRNGLSHGRIEQRSINNEIVGIRISDALYEGADDNFSIEFTIDEFLAFASRISESFLEG